jgi:signal transduction histidine kinase
MIVAFLIVFSLLSGSLFLFFKKNDPKTIAERFKSDSLSSPGNGPKTKLNTLDVLSELASSLKGYDDLHALLKQMLSVHAPSSMIIPGLNIAVADINLVKKFAGILSSMAETENMDVLLKQILAAMIKVTGAKCGCIIPVPSGQSDPKPIALSSEGGDIGVSEISTSQRLVDKVVETKTIQIHPENTDKEGRNEQDNSSSEMCIPLLCRDKYLGYVYLVNNQTRGCFGRGAKTAAEMIEAQAGIALENAHLIRKYKELTIELQFKVSEQMSDLIERNKRLEDNTLKLIESERMKTLLTGAIVHDIKNYVTAIQGNIKLFEMKFPANERVKRTSTIVTNSCIDILNLTSNLQDIARMEDGTFEVKKELLTIDHIGAMINKCRANDIFSQREISIEIKLPETCFEIEADYDLLERVLQNLFSNAVKYSPRGGRIVLSFASDQKESIIIFFNSGTPIPECSKESIFEKYGRLDDKNSHYSKGLGLFFCRMVMNAHGGRIWVETDEDGNYFKMAFRTSDYHFHGKNEPQDKGSQLEIRDSIENYTQTG